MGNHELIQGEACLRVAVAWLKQHGYDRIGIVVCASLRRYKTYQQFLLGLGKQGICFWERTIGSDPVDEAIDDIAMSFFHEGIQCVLGIGGGSVLDSAKAISFSKEAQPHCMGLRGKVQLKKCYPLICVPTTLGTGSEVSQTMVVADHRDGKKKRITHEAIQADLVVLDPTLTLHLPKEIVKVTAIDALAHAIEGISNAAFLEQKNPVILKEAIQAIGLVMNHLPQALQNVGFEKAREALQWAAYHGGFCMRRDLNACHVLAGALHQQYPAMSHGIAVGILLPEVMRINQTCCKGVYAYVEQFVFHGTGNEDALAQRFVKRVLDLLHEVAFPALQQYWKDDQEQLFERLEERLPQANRLNPQSIQSYELKTLIAHCLQR